MLNENNFKEDKEHKKISNPIDETLVKISKTIKENGKKHIQKGF